MAVIKDDEGYRLSIRRLKSGMVRIGHPNQGWFLLDPKTAESFGHLLIDSARPPSPSASNT